MEEKQNKGTFQYEYSAKEQAEIQRIRKKYAPKELDKMEQLRRLDRMVTQKGTIVSLILGILGTLILGVGMCCVMLWSEHWFTLGILVGLFGIAIVVIAYPVYMAITNKERQKIAPEILRLTDELMK